ncbi:hypothetical protein NPX13_g2040 [Xylaria arbuscula]|uniref:Uncharacterized protein n=1 Tax=Xylaria arbuscula TaxID=114810 RepID=A0A9W8NJY2_9PEZI|nr:hypothetical protein NPX13_g2040 [Xylaria arbuscula]
MATMHTTVVMKHALSDAASNLYGRAWPMYYCGGVCGMTPLGESSIHGLGVTRQVRFGSYGAPRARRVLGIAIFYTRRVASSGGESAPKHAEMVIPTTACRREHKNIAYRQARGGKATII